MREMHWSYADLCALPEFHREVLIDMLQERAAAQEHQRALAESRAAHRRR